MTTPWIIPSDCTKHPQQNDNTMDTAIWCNMLFQQTNNTMDTAIWPQYTSTAKWQHYGYSHLTTIHIHSKMTTLWIQPSDNNKHPQTDNTMDTAIDAIYICSKPTLWIQPSDSTTHPQQNDNTMDTAIWCNMHLQQTKNTMSATIWLHKAIQWIP